MNTLNQNNHPKKGNKVGQLTLQQLPVFPLSIFLLPEGITRLRIFEARYLKMIGLASDGFIILPKQSSEKDILWGSWVEIVNFDKGDDGVLEIDVRCKSLVNLKVVTLASDEIQLAEFTEITHWAQKKSNTDLGKLTVSLLSLLNSNEFLQVLYHNNNIDNPYWVVARWLELLPIPFEVKHNFLSPVSYVEAKKLVNSIV